MANGYAQAARGGRHKVPRDWYSISVDSVRRALVFVLSVAGVVGAGVGYQRWEQLTLEQRAQEAIDNAGQMSARLSQRDDEAIRNELAAARNTLERAREAFAETRFETALDLGKQAVSAFETIEQGGGDRGGPIRFQALHGGVEYRRGDRGAWRRARIKDSLHPGDWIKTSADGSAELVFTSGSKVTLRPNTMMHLIVGGDTAGSGGGEGADIVFGDVKVNTASNGGKLTTPSAQTAVGENSEAAVVVDRDRGRARFSSYSGDMEVTTSTGAKQKLGDLQEVEQVGQELSQLRSLPGRPTLLRPPDSFESDFSGEKRILLAWVPVDGIARYRLRVSRDNLFAETLIDNDKRLKPQATLGLKGEGSFFWQVAAIAADGTVGPWSETRSFRVVNLGGLGRGNDTEPPPLEITDIQTYGTLVLVNGTTEGGATVTVNGEPAAVALDGSFSKAIQMTHDSWALLDIEATDGWGNATHARRRVFIDAF